MNEHISVPRSRRSRKSIFWIFFDILFGLVGPIFLSLRYAGEFRPRATPQYWSHYYPWAFPTWAYGITIIKIVALMAWLRLRARTAEGLSWRPGLLAGIFLVGALHAIACAIVNSEALDMEAWWIPLSVVLAYLAGLSYARNFVLALLWGRAAKTRLMLGFLLGLAIAAALPAVADLLNYGKPW